MDGLEIAAAPQKSMTAPPLDRCGAIARRNE
jgi:hypothetical protein